MEIYTTQLHPNKNLDKDLHGPIDNDNNVKTNTSTHQSDVAESGKVKVTLSSTALAMLDIDNPQNDKAYEQKTKEYEMAKRQYQEKVNDLPVDYRKMKMLKDRVNEEEIKQETSILEQQIAVKSLIIIEIGQEFSQKLKEQERSNQISPKSAIDMLNTFNSSPPKAPVNN
ncbi:hypothetical protein A9Q74_04585 [Colwellia sp. 39_35_sub15_T18]|nr:hypothetical protein A9Q74_04585 [Colwellia sp. 39_35_sub15_T18]